MYRQLAWSSMGEIHVLQALHMVYKSKDLLLEGKMCLEVYKDALYLSSNDDPRTDLSPYSWHGSLQAREKQVNKSYLWLHVFRQLEHLRTSVKVLNNNKTNLCHTGKK